MCEIPLASGPFWATVRYVYLVNLGGVTELFVIESCAVSPAEMSPKLPKIALFFRCAEASQARLVTRKKG